MTQQHMTLEAWCLPQVTAADFQDYYDTLGLPLEVVRLTMEPDATPRGHRCTILVRVRGEA